MPVTPTFPGVYIEEVPSGVRTITTVATSIAAFIDFFARGPMNQAVRILSFADFERTFGGLDVRSEASYGISQFFLNGGTEAWVVRVASGPPARATVILRRAVGGGTANQALTVGALSEGDWGNFLRVGIEPTPNANRFNLIVTEVATRGGRTVVVRQERFPDLSMDTTDARFVQTIVNAEGTGSQMFRIDTVTGLNPPPLNTGTVSGSIAAPVNITPPSAGQPLRVAVTFTGAVTTTLNVNLGTTAITTIDEAAGRLESALRNANPTDPVWAQATVGVAGNRDRLQIAAGPADPSVNITFGTAPAADGFAADTATAGALQLTGGGAVSNVSYYQVGATAGKLGQTAGTRGNDGVPPSALDLIGSAAVDPPTGIFALDRVPLFNILCIPRTAIVSGAGALSAAQAATVIAGATNYCEQRRAFFLVDTPNNVTTPAEISTWLGANATLRHRNLALYFPRTRIADPLNDFRPRAIGASGTLAGVYAATDGARGVWKAPAGTEAALRGVQQLDYEMTDRENGTLNPLAINALRTFPIFGNVSWGARTLDGSDQQASEWKYVPVRRLALFIEESLLRGTQWVVFEPNDEPLWAQIRLNVGSFMQGLFRQGAFAGSSPRQAYLVKCDAETTTPRDQQLGVVNILVGFAPLRPAEFVILRIQQLAGQTQT
jgi:uncharacterized protein